MSDVELGYGAFRQIKSQLHREVALNGNGPGEKEGSELKGESDTSRKMTETVIDRNEEQEAEEGEYEEYHKYIFGDEGLHVGPFDRYI